MEPSANDSTESSLQISLQISSSSPDGIPSRALQVQVASAIQSESSASSQTPSHAEPLRRNRSRSRDSPYEGGSQQLVSSRSQSGSCAESPLSSHRGPGSLTALEDRQGSGGGLPPTGQPVTLVRQHDQRSVVRNRHQHVQAQDQRSVHQHVHQHAYDQRSMQVQVGMDPVAVIQHVQGVERHAHAAIHEAHSEVTSTQRLADQAVQNIVQEARTHVSEVQAQAQVQVQSVETRAQAIVSDMETNYQREIAQIQDIAQRAYEDSQHRLSQMEDRNRELLAIIESQSQALESQRDEQRNLMNQVGSLQSEITMLRHSSAQYDVPFQDQNGTVDVSGLMQMMNSLKDEIKVLRGRHTRKKKHESYVDSRVAASPEYAQSACAVQDIHRLRILVQHIRCTRVVRKSPKSQMLHHRCFRFQHVVTWGMLQQLNCQEVQPKRDSIRHLMTHPRHLHRPVIGMEVEGDHLIVEGDHLLMTVQHRPDLGD